MRKQIIWLSFDLGIRGDHEGLYAWLDEHKAKECGDSLATMKYKHDGKTLQEKLKSEIEVRVKIDSRTRIYVIYRDPESGSNKGSFIFGNRRAPSWTGYAPSDDNVDQE